ncbi:MAG: dephospho-CoA kinase [Hyphomicrobiaceae bacterium]|nr:dephospho-CoA kinase [Hyphomicrobiaceae bacterium]
MLVIGLTGSIGMGKSTAAARFKDNGIGVFDADAAVHELYAGKAVPLIEAAFPGTTRDGQVDRQSLLAALMKDASGFKRLEAIVHPLVREMEAHFLRSERDRGALMAVLEIPLLLETGGDKLVDVTVIVSAPVAMQRERVLARPGMTEAKFAEIAGRQMPDEEKRQRADFVVDTGGSIADTQAQIDRLVVQLAGRTGTAYQRYWAGA